MTWQPPMLWRYTLREVWRRPGRAALTLLGLVIGVAVFVALTTGPRALAVVFRDLFQALAGRATLEVVAAGDAPFAPDLPALRAVPGVRAAVPVVQTPVGLATPAGPLPLLAVAVDPGRDAAARDYLLEQGQNLTEASGLLLPADFAARHGLGVGAVVRLTTPAGPLEVPVVGLLRPGPLTAFNGGAVAFLPLDQARPALAPPGTVTAVQLVVEGNGEDVRRRVAALLPPGQAVRAPAERAVLAGDTVASMDLAMSSLSVVALVAGGFVVLNTFHMNLGERRRQLALFRAVGATPRQVVQMLLREAALLGVVGTALGLPLGLLLAAGLRRVNEDMLGVALPPPRLSSLNLTLAVLLGTCLALLATWPVARRAVRRTPLADLAARPALADERHGCGVPLLGVGLIGAGLGVVATVPLGWLAPENGPVLLTLATVLCLVGGVLALPPLLPPLLTGAAHLLRVAGPEGRLALLQLQRQPTRTALTAGGLFIGVAVSLSFGQSFLNNLADIRRWCDRILGAPFLVRATVPDPSTTLTVAALPRGLEDEVRALAAAASVERIRFVATQADGRAALLLAREFLPGEPPLDLVEGDADLARRLADGEAALAISLARRLGLKAGDTVTLATPQGPRAVRVAATVREYGTGGMALYLDWHAAARMYGFDAAQVLAVNARPGREAELGEQLEALCAARGLLLQRDADFRALIERIAAGVKLTLRSLLVLVFLVSALGVVNTLTTNVVEQTRQLGVLRALGLRRRQLYRLVLWQALLLALAGGLPGVLAGLGMAWVMNATTPALLGVVVPFRVSPLLAVACLLGAAVVAAAAALLPARRAARLHVVAALRYE
jgi:putative ABC transport system permease protein